MRAAALTAGLTLLIAGPALAQHQDHPQAPPPAEAEVMDAMDWPTEVAGDPAAPDAPDGMAGMAGMDHSAHGEPVGDAPPPPTPTDFAADRLFDRETMARARTQLFAEHGGGSYSKVMVSLAEAQVRNGEDGYRWAGEAWFGGDLNRLVLKTEGEGGQSSGLEAAELQALYSRAVGPYFDLQVGMRQDFEPQPRRTYLTVGFEGLAPYWVDTEGALFLSSRGELLGRVGGSHDLRLTQRWILQSRAEINLSAQDIPEIALGSGVNNIELGLRLRHQVRPEFAPYLGLSFDRKLGDTARLARAAGDGVEATSIVVGIRAWF